MGHKNTIGKYLRDMREKQRLPQVVISVRLGYKSPQFISNIERGVALPPIDKLRAWCKIIGADQKHVAKLMVDQYIASIEQELGVKL